jgi:hypothetical protein
VEEVGKALTWQHKRSGWRRSVVLMAVLGHGGEGWVDGVVPERFDMEEEHGTGVKEHV